MRASNNDAMQTARMHRLTRATERKAKPMTLTDIMKACARAKRLAATDTERQGVARASAAILDAFNVTHIDRAHFLRIADGAA